MKHIMVLLAGLAVLMGGVQAQEKIAGTPLSQEASWKGYLVDVQYGGALAVDPATALSKAAAYAKSSALDKGASHGFGIVAKGQWLKFDAAGNEKALEIVRNAKREQGFFVKVTGKLQGDTIAVTSIEEIGENDPSQYY